MLRVIQKFFQDETGATAIEYTLIAAIIGISVIAGATSIGNTLSDTFTELNNAVVEANAD